MLYYQHFYIIYHIYLLAKHCFYSAAMCGVEKAGRDYITAEALQGYLAIRITQHREKGDGRGRLAGDAGQVEGVAGGGQEAGPAPRPPPCRAARLDTVT